MHGSRLFRPETVGRTSPRRMFLVAVMTAALGGAASCSPTPQLDDSGAEQAPSVGAVPIASDDASTRAVLPGLFGLMAGLESDMAGLARALWQEQMDSVALFARAVADHPTVPAAEAQAIAGVLGPDMARFKAFDTGVHDLAVRVSESAAANDLDGVVAAEAQLRAGCVACHTAFRVRLRDALR